MLKKLFTCLLALIAMFCLNACEDKKTSSQSESSLRVGSEFAYVPYNWEEDKASEKTVPIENHQGFYGDGYDIQIAKLIGQNLDKKVIFLKIPFEGLMQALNNGQIDIIVSGMLDSPEHKQAAAFSKTYAVVPTEYTVLVNADSKYAKATKLEELKDASILGQRGTRLDTVIDQIPSVNHISPVDTIPAMLDRLLKGTVDGIVINKETVGVYTEEHKNLKGLNFAKGDGFKLDFSGICVGVRKDDKKMLDGVNKALAKIPESQRKEIFESATKRAEKFN